MYEEEKGQRQESHKRWPMGRGFLWRPPPFSLPFHSCILSLPSGWGVGQVLECPKLFPHQGIMSLINICFLFLHTFYFFLFLFLFSFVLFHSFLRTFSLFVLFNYLFSYSLLFFVPFVFLFGLFISFPLSSFLSVLFLSLFSFFSFSF